MRLSVIVVTKENKDGLSRTLRSILNQRINSTEVIIKDGLSTDGTECIVSELEKGFSRRGCRMLFLQTADTGIYDAMNQALKLCGDTDYTLFLNAGDCFYDHDVIENLEKILSGLDADIVFGLTNVRILRGRSFVLKPNVFMNDFVFCHQSVLVKTELMVKTGFDITYKIASDRDMLFSLISEGHKTQVLNLVIADYSHDGISSKNYDGLYSEIDLIDRKYGIKKKGHKAAVNRMKTIITSVCPVMADISFLYKRMR